MILRRTLLMSLAAMPVAVLAARPGDVGSITRLFHDMRKQQAAGLPDGIKVAQSGHVLTTGPGGVHVLTPNRELLGIIGTEKAVSNCCFGPDGASLYLTSSDMLAVVPLLLRRHRF